MGMTLNAYCALRYSALASQRAKLSGLPCWQYNLITALNMMFGISVCVLMLIFVVIPAPREETMHKIRIHSGAFVFYLFWQFIALAANWWKAASVTAMQWIYLAMRGTLTMLMAALALYTLCKYANDGVPVVNSILAQCVDWMWFSTLPLTAMFMPYQPPIKLQYSVVVEQSQGDYSGVEAAACSPRP